MEFKKTLLTTTLLTFFLLYNVLETSAQRRDFTVAFVNSRAVMAEMAEWKTAEAQIQTYADSMNAVLAEKVETLAAGYKKLQKQMPILSGNAGNRYLAEKKEELRKQQKEVDKIKETIPKAIDKRVTQLTESLEDRIEDAIIFVSKTEKFDFVFDSEDEEYFYISTVAYDLTNTVIEEVNKE